MPTSLGPAEILVILVVALVVLGPNRLPEAGRQVGKALAEVRHWSESLRSEMNSVINTEATPVPEPPSPDAASDVAGYTDPDTGTNTDTNGSGPAPTLLPAPPEPPAGEARTP